MRNTIYRLLSLVFVALALVSCKDSLRMQKFSVNVTEISAMNEGGEFPLELTSGSSWTSSSDSPWVTVSPANGPSSATCRILVDSTVLTDGRSALVRFFNSATGERCDVHVNQGGFDYSIRVVGGDINLKHFALLENRTFEVKVVANLPFDVVIPSSASKWLSCETPSFSFDRGSRPREFTLKFKWGANTIPVGREVAVRLVPKAGYPNSVACEFNVMQDAAPEIKIGHEGDSIALVSMAASLGLLNPIVTADAMSNWDNVELWEESDPGYTPEKAGRVRYAYFALFQTEESIPFEVQYLTEAEELVFFSNVNSFLYSLDLGEYICKLTNLKRLTVSAYGISSLPDEFVNLKNLEWLDLSSNNFSKLPDILTQENFPKLHALMLNTCQRSTILDLSNTVHTDLCGFKGEFPRRLLEWENLDTLRLSVNFIEGQMPDMLDYEVTYTAEDCKTMNLPETLVGTPKVLPNAKYFAFNLNRMYGRLPDWVLYHPNLTLWNPYSLCYPQEGRASNGKAAAFNNVPANMDYYWSFYEGYKEHEDIYLGD